MDHRSVVAVLRNVGRQGRLGRGRDEIVPYRHRDVENLSVQLSRDEAVVSHHEVRAASAADEE